MAEAVSGIMGGGGGKGGGGGNIISKVLEMVSKIAGGAVG